MKLRLLLEMLLDYRICLMLFCRAVPVIWWSVWSLDQTRQMAERLDRFASQMAFHRTERRYLRAGLVCQPTQKALCAVAPRGPHYCCFLQTIGLLDLRHRH